MKKKTICVQGIGFVGAAMLSVLADARNKKKEAFYNLGNTLTVKGDFRKAIKAFKKAIELKPDYFDALNNLGATYNLYKDYSNALKSISKALKIRPNIADAYNNLGTAELNLEKSSRSLLDRLKSNLGCHFQSFTGATICSFISVILYIITSFRLTNLIKKKIKHQ